MPDETQTKEGQDLKTGDGQPSGTGQSDTKDQGGDEETVTIKKSELEQIKSDRDNYRAATLDKKSADRELKQNTGEADKKDAGTGTISLDEAKITEIARRESQSFTEQARKSNQQRATKVFLQNHKEYLNDSEWNNLMSDFRSTANDATVEDFVDRLEETMLLHKRRTGKLDEYLSSERERGRKEGLTQAEIESGHHSGGVGDKNEGQSEKKLSEKGVEIARGVKLDPTKVEKVDPSKDNVINIV